MSEHDDMLKALRESQRLPDHGITPAQLREKVEALESELSELVLKQARAISRHGEQLDAALKRIEQLEGQVQNILTVGGAVRQKFGEGQP